MVAQKKLRDHHHLRYLVVKKPFSTFCVTSQAEGANQGSPFNTYGHDSQAIIDKGMGRGDHQTPQEIGTKCGINGVMAISPIDHVTSLNPTTTINAINLNVSIASESNIATIPIPTKIWLELNTTFQLIKKRGNL